MTSYTKEQETIVKKTLSFKSHQYYEVLEVLKSSSDSEIKKSYRKLAIKLHPDKNPHPRSSEAFKFLNKAWGVLSDSNKRQIYDQTGADPDARGGGGSGADPFASAEAFSRAARGGQRQQFQGYQGNEDIFNMFFGGGMPGTGGPGGPTFMFGNNGFSYTFGGDQFHNVRQRRGANGAGRRHQQQEEESKTTAQLVQLVPIFLFLMVFFLSSLFGGSGTPEYSFTPTRKFSTKRETPKYSIPFYVAKDFANTQGLDALQLQNFDRKVESIYIQDKRSKCSREQIRKNDLIEESQGWFFTDQAKLDEANNMPMPNCGILRGMDLL